LVRRNIDVHHDGAWWRLFSTRYLLRNRSLPYETGGLIEKYRLGTRIAKVW
jgi:hypothetical protein